MRVRLTLTALLLSSIWEPACAAGPPDPAPAKLRGICWEAAGPVDKGDLEPLRELGVRWISQTPFGWSPSLTEPSIRYASDRGPWGETDGGLAATAAAARALGIKSLLKPHLWVKHGAWQGDIAMTSEADWKAWFASYEEFILHYASLAQSAGFEALSVGTELGKTTGHTLEWKRLIARVREVFHGQLTYCANWNAEPESIGFWGDLDFIGIQAYYPLATTDDPGKAEIERAWAPIAVKLEALAERTGKPVVFTEVGFKSHTGSLKQPWLWDTDGDVDYALQRDAFAALFETFWGKRWFGGTFVWKWHPSPRSSSRMSRDFTPQGKPALSVIKSYYAAR